MATLVALASVSGFLVVAIVAAVLGRRAVANAIVYGATGAVALIALGAALARLIGGSGDGGLVLPIGLPGLGAHLRMDALAAFFLLVVNLGGAAASLYALGYGAHETAPRRVLPFVPAYLAGMNLTVLADDAFTFLLAFEFMSLPSSALVMAHHRDPANARAGYISLAVAEFGTFCLLLAVQVLAGGGAADDVPA